MSSYRSGQKYDIEQGKAPPVDPEREPRESGRSKHKHRRPHRKHHGRHKHHFRHQQPKTRIDKMQPAHEKRGLEARNGQVDLPEVDDIVKDLSYLLSVPKQEEHHQDSLYKHCHEDSKEHHDNGQSLFKVQELETRENKNVDDVAINLDEVSVDSALEEQEQRAGASLGPNFEPQKQRPSYPGAFRERGPGVDSTVGDDDEFTSNSPTDLERGMAGGNESGLAVAQKVNEEEEEPVLMTATKYDPAAKPPLYRSRRFKLYMIAIVVLLLIAIVAVLAVVLPGRDEDEDLGAPTAAPTTLREYTFLEQFVLEVGDAVNEEGTPQNRAAEWIMSEDPRGLSPDALNLMQRYHMALLYFETTNNGEKAWNSCNPPLENETDECLYIAHEFDSTGNLNATRWLSGTHECEWIGVFCDPIQNIIQLEVANQNITTTLPTEISLLPNLQAISFSTNEFFGTIPEVYAEMEQLASLELHYNMLTGTLPDVYWQASALQSLNVGRNFLSGTISTHVGTLSQLKGLHLFQNNFSGTIPIEIGNARNLSYVYLYENGLVGEIPSELGELVLLKELWVSENGLEGRIPSELGLIRDVEIFEIYDNRLTGTIPEELYNLTQVFAFDVNRNGLSGTISSRIGQLSNLEFFRVSTNDFNGTIPSEVGNLDKIVLLWFHETHFTGTVPESLCVYRPNPLVILQADCNPPEDPPVPCLCCSHCCDRNSGICLSET